RPPANGPAAGPQGMGDLLLQPPAFFLEPSPPRPDVDARRPWDHAQRAEAWWGSFDAHLVVHDPSRAPDEPILGSRWQTDEAVQVSVAGPLFLFSQVGAGFDTLTTQQQRFTGRTGLGCRLRPGLGGEIVVHGGPALSHTEDPLRPDQLPRGRAEM